VVADCHDRGEVTSESAGRHGANVPRGLERPVDPPPGRGRFGKLFPCLSAAELRTGTIDALVAALRDRGGGFNTDLPAGYTYLAQFVDHDITFDPTSKLQGDNDPNAVVNFRTPRFDLDSLYGSGPKDQPFLYDWSPQVAPGVKLLVGSNAGDGAITYDLPRNEQGRALIGDARNDEHLIIAQLHLLFIRFHNKVVDHVLAEKPALRGMALLEEAQQIVRHHYQWIVMHDFLPRVVGGKMAAAARAERRFYKWNDEPFIPFEFSVAAYRFGHSMVRGDYKPNRHVKHAVAIFAKGDNPGELDHLGGFRRLPVAMTIDWTFFFALSRHRPPDPDRPQQSRLIDTNLAPGLFSLPAGVDPQRRPLPELNLRRGRALKLPSGFDVACAMGVERLTVDELLLDDVSPAKARDAVLRAPPLWYYVLCEAESKRLGDGGRHLGPVGGGIVAEVLVGLLEADPSSYLRVEPAWKPTLPRAKDRTFTMPDLVRFTLRDD
jgi:hypothetical protein